MIRKVAAARHGQVTFPTHPQCLVWGFIAMMQPSALQAMYEHGIGALNPGTADTVYRAAHMAMQDKFSD
jgi:hypothetical protein